ncbi:MAG: hypothetical protein IPM79_07805 [Polyangiaceae bacterium]|jgi:hypothetical protein|nr:hypothetical protein [Polyangiaceae bacterium]MBK8937537.1 hypothetical protein [Polyangiaceae bacterium]
MIKQRIIMGLLALGTIGGFAAGFASMSCHAKSRRERFKDEVAQTCVRAARSVDAADRGQEDDQDSADEPREGRRGRRHHGDR